MEDGDTEFLESRPAPSATSKTNIKGPLTKAVPDPFPTPQFISPVHKVPHPNNSKSLFFSISHFIISTYYYNITTFYPVEANNFANDFIHLLTLPHS